MKVRSALIQLAFRKGVDNALTAAEGFIAEAAADGAEWRAILHQRAHERGNCEKHGERAYHHAKCRLEASINF